MSALTASIGDAFTHEPSRHTHTDSLAIRLSSLSALDGSVAEAAEHPPRSGRPITGPLHCGRHQGSILIGSATAFHCWESQHRQQNDPAPDTAEPTSRIESLLYLTYRMPVDPGQALAQLAQATHHPARMCLLAASLAGVAVNGQAAGCRRR